jgi:putative ABC transport system substrate-binding protein
VNRRQIIKTFGCALVAWPRAALAQKGARIRRTGLLGRNIAIDLRFAGLDAASIQARAHELVNSAPDVIVAHTSPIVAALKQAARTIPIIFSMVNDPVGQGIITNLARPGGNITGFTLIDFDIVGKWVQVLAEMVPSINRAALLFNPVMTSYHDVYFS